MNKREYLAQLERELKRNHVPDAGEILNEYPAFLVLTWRPAPRRRRYPPGWGSPPPWQPSSTGLVRRLRPATSRWRLLAYALWIFWRCACF